MVNIGIVVYGVDYCIEHDIVIVNNFEHLNIGIRPLTTTVLNAIGYSNQFRQPVSTVTVFQVTRCQRWCRCSGMLPVFDDSRCSVQPNHPVLSLQSNQSPGSMSTDNAARFPTVSRWLPSRCPIQRFQDPSSCYSDSSHGRCLQVFQVPGVR